MGRRYKNPPIIEALCEFRLQPDTQWDLTTPGLIYDRVKDAFESREGGIVQEMQITSGKDGFNQQTRTREVVRMFSKDKNRFMQVGPRLLSVHTLQPYPSWAMFKPLIERAFTALTETTNADAFQRVGLRYINRIEIAQQSVDLDDYFEFRPFLGQNLPQKTISFIVGCLLPYSDGRDVCKVEFTTAARGQPDQCSFILDLDYSNLSSEAVPIGGSLNWIENAHDKVTSLFEGCITDQSRKIFQEVT